MEAVLDVTGDVLDVTEKAIEVSAQQHGLHGPYGQGAKYVSEKLSLSLVHQANVVAVKRNGDGTLAVYSGSFTVWSGATDKSTKTYYLSQHLGESVCVRVRGALMGWCVGDLDMRIVTPVDQAGEWAC